MRLARPNFSVLEVLENHCNSVDESIYIVSYISNYRRFISVFCRYEYKKQDIQCWKSSIIKHMKPYILSATFRIIWHVASIYFFFRCEWWSSNILCWNCWKSAVIRLMNPYFLSAAVWIIGRLSLWVFDMNDERKDETIQWWKCRKRTVIRSLTLRLSATFQIVWHLPLFSFDENDGHLKRFCGCHQI